MGNAYFLDESKKERRFCAVDILWDIDDDGDEDEDCAAPVLPEVVEIPDVIRNDNDAISDYLSDLTGFCHKGFRTEWLSLDDVAKHAEREV